MDATMSRAARWYHAHKDDPAVKARLLEARRKSYQLHKEKEKAAALARYYRLKGTVEPPAPGDGQS
jgi:hypothetical protein